MDAVPPEIRVATIDDGMGWAPDGGERERQSERLPLPAVRHVRAL